MNETNRIKNKQTLLYVLTAICLSVFFIIVYRFGINIPMDDDYTLQNFLLRFINAESWSEKMRLMLEAGNMHRLVWMRLMVLLVYFICGQLNYSAYIFLTGLFLLGIAFMLLYCKAEKKQGIAALAIALLLFNGQNLGNMTWAMSGLANIGSVFITLASIALLLVEKKPYALLFGILFALMTIYSNGNGMLLIPVIAICLWLQKRIKTLIIFAIITIPAAALYFYGLDSSRMGGDLWHNIPIMILNVFVFVGNNLWIPSFGAAALVVGLICASVYVWGIVNGVYKTNLFLYACLTFFYLTAVVVALGNASVFGGESTTPWRYRTYGSMFLVLTALLLIRNAKAFHIGKPAIYIFITVALSFSVLSTTYCYRKAERRYEQKIVSAYHWHREGKNLGLYYPEHDETIAAELKKAEHLGIYAMPRFPVSAYKNSLCIHSESGENRQLFTEGIRYKVETQTEDNFLIISGWAYISASEISMESKDIYIYLTAEGKRWVCRPNFERRFDVINDTTKADCGFVAVIDKNEIPQGIYQIEIGIRARRPFKRPEYFVATGQFTEIIL